MTLVNFWNIQGKVLPEKINVYSASSVSSMGSLSKIRPERKQRVKIARIQNKKTYSEQLKSKSN